MIRYLILLIVISLAAPGLHGQTISDVKFSYDAAGNRTERTIYYESGGQKSAKVSYEEEEEEEEPLFDPGLNVYPNPATHSIYLTLNQEVLESKRQELYVFDMLGKVVYQSNILAETNQIDVSKWPVGNYILKLIFDNKHEEWIIVKQ